MTDSTAGATKSDETFHNFVLTLANYAEAFYKYNGGGFIFIETGVTGTPSNYTVVSVEFNNARADLVY